jgi:hypothetical protein
MLPVAVSLQAKAVRLAGHGVGAPKSGASATLRKTRAPGAGGRGFRRLSLECNCRRRCRGALLYAAWTRCGTHELHESEHPLTGPPAAGQCPDRSLRRVGEQDQSIGLPVHRPAVVDRPGRPWLRLGNAAGLPDHHAVPAEDSMRLDPRRFGHASRREDDRDPSSVEHLLGHGARHAEPADEAGMARLARCPPSRRGEPGERKPQAPGDLGGTRCVRGRD